jgi:hypothetical protein
MLAKNLRQNYETNRSFSGYSWVIRRVYECTLRRFCERYSTYLRSSGRIKYDVSPNFRQIAMGLRWICEGFTVIIRSFCDWATMKMRRIAKEMRIISNLHTKLHCDEGFCRKCFAILSYRFAKFVTRRKSFVFFGPEMSPNFYEDFAKGLRRPFVFPS